MDNKFYAWIFSFSFILFSISAVVGQTEFINEADDLGLFYSYSGGNVMGAGVSFCDIDGDGWDDISIATGVGDSLKIFKNNMGTFEEWDIGIIDTTNVKMVSWVDMDNDGDQDLMLVSYTDNRMFENTGDMTFVEITESSGIETEFLFSYSAAWGDFNNDSYLDLYLSNRIFADTSANMLYKNNGDMTFTDITVEANLRDSSTFSFSSIWFDYNNDGYQDLYVTSDRITHPNRLFRNLGDETFLEVSLTTNSLVAMDAMCATVEDYNYDGYLDIYVTNTPDGSILLQNSESATFTDTADGSGVGYYGIGWGSCFLDGENDGDMDLYVSGMGVGDEFVSSKYYENDGTGSFINPTDAGFIGDSAISFGNAIGDFNNDGFYDIAVSNMDSNMHLWVNQGNEMHWLKVNLEGVESNRDGIGSWIHTFNDGEDQVRYTSNGESFAGQFSYYEGFGLAAHTMVDSLQVYWLSGIVDRLYDVPADQSILILEGSSHVETPVILKNDSILCLGDSILLSVEQSYSNYLWSNGDTTSTIMVYEEGDYSVEVWNLYTVHRSSSVTIGMDTQMLDLGSDTLLCNDELLVLDIGVWDEVEWEDGSTDQVRIIDEAGFYYVDVISSADCAHSDSILVEYDECLSVNSPMRNNIKIGPNPCDESFFLMGDYSAAKGYRIYNSSYSLIREVNASLKREINVSELKSGMYIIEFIYDDGSSYSRLIKK